MYLCIETEFMWLSSTHPYTSQKTMVREGGGVREKKLLRERDRELFMCNTFVVNNIMLISAREFDTDVIIGLLLGAMNDLICIIWSAMTFSMEQNDTSVLSVEVLGGPGIGMKWVYFFL